MRLRRILAGGIVLALLWAVWDLTNTRRLDLRRFDGHEVGRLETAMWRSYYEHRRPALYVELVELLREQYHLPFLQANVAAYHAARAAVVFQRGHGRSEYMLALPDLERFYALIRRHSVTEFDVNSAAKLELEWWIIHRERAQHPTGDLEAALAALQAEIYRRPAAEFGGHAKARADAMVLRDNNAATPNWETIGGLLDRSWVNLQSTVSR